MSVQDPLPLPPKPPHQPPDDESTPLSRQQNRHLNRQVHAVLDSLVTNLVRAGVPHDELWERAATCLSAFIASLEAQQLYLHASIMNAIPDLAKVIAHARRHGSN